MPLGCGTSWSSWETDWRSLAAISAKPKATQERYEHLVEFTDSVFQNAPFSIVATDTRGLITAMNVAAEKLTGYTCEDLVGKAALTILHDEKELAPKAEDGVRPPMVSQC